MGDVFGVRKKDKTLYSHEGFLEFEKVRNSHNFIKLVAKVIEKVK